MGAMDKFHSALAIYLSIEHTKTFCQYKNKKRIKKEEKSKNCNIEGEFLVCDEMLVKRTIQLNDCMVFRV